METFCSDFHSNTYDDHEFYRLQYTTKKLERKKNKDTDNPQLEMAILQDVHKQKVTEARQRYQDKVNEYEEKNRTTWTSFIAVWLGNQSLMILKFMTMQKSIQILQQKNNSLPRRSKVLKLELYLSRKNYLLYKIKDVSRRVQDHTDEKKKKTTEKCELNPNIMKQNDKGTKGKSSSTKYIHGRSIESATSIVWCWK